MNIDLIKKIDFGEIDGYGDPNLEKYFLDNDYWQKVIDSNVFFVVGKKGTGKSSIYQMIARESFEKGCLVINKDFGEFPFEKLLNLHDDNFAKPNQYQTIWKNVIFNLFIQAIAQLPAEENEYYKEIKQYQEMYLGNSIDLHKDIVSTTTKTQGSLLAHGLGLSREKGVQCDFKFDDNNITTINSCLFRLLENYFVTTSFDRKIVIQFDRLDDNYNQYQDAEEYYQAMISLFKAVYNFNQSLRSKSVNCAKVVLYIRSDIIKAMASRDAESARWDDFRFDLDWRVNSIKEIYQSDLYKMVKKRIDASCPEASEKTFNEIFAPEKDLELECRELDFFKVLVLQTLFRPRDLIKLLKTLQKSVCGKGRLNCASYNETLKKYSHWLVNTEIANEINPVFKDDYPYVIELLRLCGSRNMTVKSFSVRYYSVRHTFKMKPSLLIKTPIN